MARKRRSGRSSRSSYKRGYRDARSSYRRSTARDYLTTAFGPRGSEPSVNMWGPTYREANTNQRALRKTLGYRGRGSYSSAARGAVRFLPHAISAARGAVQGWRSSRGLRGRGNYDADATPVIENDPGNLYGPTETNQLIEGGNAPMTVNSTGDETGDIIFSHREFVGNVTSKGATFNNQSYPLNPALPNTFPFLAQLAKYFTLYEFIGLVFEYRPTSGEFGNSTNQLGKVIMATDYDPDSLPFTSSQRMENYDYAVASKPSLTVQHGVETAPSQMALKMNYTRTGDTTRDKIFTDLGLFQIATEGIPYEGVIGELWVSYKVKLSRSQIADEQRLSTYLFTNQGFDNAPLGIPGTGGYTVVKNTIPLTLAQNSFFFPKDAFALQGLSFLVQYSVQALDPNVPPPGGSSGSYVQVLNNTFPGGGGLAYVPGYFQTPGSSGNDDVLHIFDERTGSMTFLAVVRVVDINTAGLFFDTTNWPEDPQRITLSVTQIITEEQINPVF